MVSDAGARSERNRVALGMFRFTGKGFALAGSWNGGHPFITKGRLKVSQFEIDDLVDKRY